MYDRKNGRDTIHLHRKMREEEENARIKRKKEQSEKKSASTGNLSISEPEDASEKEADTIAKKVVNGQPAELPTNFNHGSAIQTKTEATSSQTTDDLQTQLSSSKGGGQTLDDATKGEMESKMGADFSDVKIHTGANANVMNENVNAKAFAHGKDIYFRNGNYNPSSSEGKELLAHELVHTQQQEGVVRRQPMQNAKTDYPTKLELPVGDKIISVRIQRDSDKKTISTEQFLGPVYASSYTATLPLGADIGNYTVFVTTLKSGIKTVHMSNVNSYFGFASVEITVKQLTPEEIETNELKKFDVKKDPQNEASLISDAKLKTTAVYSDLLKKSTAKLPADKEKEAILATRMMLRDVQDPLIGTVVKSKNYLLLAKKQLGVVSSMETNFTVGGNGKNQGSFKWHAENSVNSTDFSIWVNGNGPEPSPDPTNRTLNNCWGVIFYGAYKAGYAPKDWIRTMYQQTVVRQNDVYNTITKDPNESAKYITTIEDYVSGGKYYDYDEKTKRPLAGDLVIWDTAYNHIVIATGKNDPVYGSPQVISLWTIPNNNFLQYTSLKQLSGAKGKIKFFSPIWN